MKRTRLPFFCLALFLLSGCATLPNGGILPSRFSTFQKEKPHTAALWQALNRAIVTAGVRDTSNFAVKGFPYLKANRFLIGLKRHLASEKAFLEWVDLLQQADWAVRAKEFENLPPSQVRALAAQFHLAPTHQALFKKYQELSRELLAKDRARPSFQEDLLKATVAPTEYSTARRIIGLYPLASVGVVQGSKAAYEEFKAWHRKPFNDFTVSGTMTVFTPQPLSPKAKTYDQLRSVFQQAPRDVLGIPQLTQTQLEDFVDFFAPVLYQDIAASYDRFGEVTWHNGHVQIDGSHPTLYYYVTYNFIQGHPVMQLNYSLWYSGRRGPNAPWLERGALDGFTSRVTLSADGDPVMVENMNNCGCYHFYVPNKKYIAGVIPSKPGPDALVVAWLPEQYPRDPLNLKVNSGWHQVQRLRAARPEGKHFSYQLLPYDVLESLPHQDGRRECF